MAPLRVLGGLVGERESTTSRPTMNDVADLAGVSGKSVSRVLRGEKYVSEDVVDRVQKAMLQLNYRPNLAASQLRSGQGVTAIGLVVVDISNPFSSALHRAVEDTFEAEGIAVMATSTDEDANKERKAVNAFLSRRLGGLIVMPSSHDQSYLAEEVVSGTSVVMVDRPPLHLGVDGVLSDNRQGARVAVQHLLAHGHRRIALLGPAATIASAQLRHEGYLDALRSYGAGLDPALIHQDLDGGADVTRALQRCLSQPVPPTAFFIAQNALCVPTIRALRDRHLYENTGLVAFDGYEGDDLLTPGLTVVRQDVAGMGHLAAGRLLLRMQGLREPPSTTLLPVELIDRGSGASGIHTA